MYQFSNSNNEMLRRAQHDNSNQYRSTATLLDCYINYFVSLSLKISPKTPLAVTFAPAPAPMITIGCSP